VGKSVIQTIIGFFTFGGVHFHPLNVAGIVLNLLGGGLYSYAKYEETNMRPLCAMPNIARSVMNGHSTNGAKGDPSRSVAISVEDLMASRVVKIKSDNDQSDYPRKVM